jgi:Domain of unknown function (DUF4375)
MARENKIPWLDYAGQDTAQILSCKGTHRIESLLCALEQAIELRQNRIPDFATTPEEHALLAIMALQREVNNGGYHQFFGNSSCKYALTVVPALESIGCDSTAALTQRAIDALNLHPLTLKEIEDSVFKPNPERDQALDALDKQFYEVFEIETKLFTFVESRRHAFVLGKMSVAPRPPKRGNRNLIALGVGLDFAPKTDRTFEAVRKLAAEIAIQKEIEPTDLELDGAAYLFLFKSFLKTGELEQCETFAGPAFDLTREDTGHCILQRQWVEKLIELSNFTRADEVTRQYLEYLSGDDTSIDFIKNRIKFWADPLRRHGAELPMSSEFFRANFPEVSLNDPPAPRLQWVKGKIVRT